MQVKSISAKEKVKNSILKSQYFDIDENRLNECLSHIEILELEDDQVIFSEGDLGYEMYVILEGEILLFTQDISFNEMILARLNPGDFFGEQCLLPKTHGKRIKSARSAGPVKLGKISKKLFNDYFLSSGLTQQNLKKKQQRDLEKKHILKDQIESDWQIESLLSKGEKVYFESKNKVFLEGEEPDYLYYVESGSVCFLKGSQHKVIAQFHKGNFFGELSLLRIGKRFATAVAQGDLQCIRIRKDVFLDCLRSNKNLKKFFGKQTLRYDIPNLGFLTSFHQKIKNKECLVSQIDFISGKSISFTNYLFFDRVEAKSLELDKDTFEKHGDLLEFDDTENSLHIKVELLDDKIVGFVIIGHSAYTVQLVKKLLNSEVITGWQKQVFKEIGRFEIEDKPLFGSKNEIVCNCVQVKRGKILDAIDSGSSTFESISALTGAGTVCGGCTPTINEMLGNQSWKRLSLVKSQKITNDKMLFDFKPTEGKIGKIKPGQYIIIQTLIQGEWVQRPYTVASCSRELDRLQLMIKCEENGLFSNWIFEHADSSSFFRVSEALGNFTFDQQKKGPIIFFAAGIGITPALAFGTAINKKCNQSLHIDFSLSTEDEVSKFKKVLNKKIDSKSVHVNYRITKNQGRICEDDVQKIAKDYPNACFYICGPKEYQKSIFSFLKRSKVKNSMIFIEEFKHQGVKPKLNKRSKKIKCSHFADIKPPPQTPKPKKPAVCPFKQFTVPESGSLYDEAKSFIQQFCFENKIVDTFYTRWQEIEQEMAEKSMYTQSYDELAFGARLAWRNSERCIGRFYWSGLKIRDFRHLTDEALIFDEICEHISLASGKGNLQPVITVFAPQVPGNEAPRIWNPQLIRYAGYKMEDGLWVGDPEHYTFTNACLKLGWKPPKKKTNYDLLPIIIQLPGKDPQWFQLPKELVLEVDLIHPEFSWFKDLNLKWHALPAVSNMALDCGGLKYTMAPFNGWYMETEIGARNLSDTYRYNALPSIGKNMGLDIKDQRSLWQDLALIELNKAVLFSFDSAGIKIGDHHELSSKFLEFVDNETSAGRDVAGKWMWLVPPISASQSPLWPIGWKTIRNKPTYIHQKPPYDDD